MAVTLLDITNSVYGKMSEFDDSITYDKQQVVIPRINSVIRNVCKGEYISYLNPTTSFKAGDISFLRKDKQYKVTKGYKTENVINEGDTTIALYSDFIWGGGKVPASISDGALLIGGDIVPYTNATIFSTLEPNLIINGSSYTLLQDAVAIEELYIDGVLQSPSTYSLSGKRNVMFNSPVNSVDVDIQYVLKVEVDVDALIKEYVSGTTIEKLIPLESDYYKQLDVQYNYKDGSNLKLEFCDFRYRKPYNNYYTMIGTNETGMYLYIKSTLEGVFTFSYYYLPEDLVDDTDVCVIPENFGLDIIAVIVAGELLMEAEEEVHGQRLLNMGYVKLQMMYKNYSELDKTRRQKIRYTIVDSSYIY